MSFTNYRKHVRLPDWDYGTGAWYYVTICTGGREYYFGEVRHNAMVLSDIGKTAVECWQKIPEIYPGIELDEFIVMPNHIHGILIYCDDNAKPLGRVIGAYKRAVSVEARRNGVPQFSWQANYYEHILRNDRSLFKIREYIRYNPLGWELEKDHSENIVPL